MVVLVKWLLEYIWFFGIFCVFELRKIIIVYLEGVGIVIIYKVFFIKLKREVVIVIIIKYNNKR